MAKIRSREYIQRINLPEAGGSADESRFNGGQTIMLAHLSKVAVLGVLLLTEASLIADDKPTPTPVAWKKTVIEGKFRSEGVAIADVNKDGKLDILIGDSWYESPYLEQARYPQARRLRRRPPQLQQVHGLLDRRHQRRRLDRPDRRRFSRRSPPTGTRTPQGKAGYWPQHEIWHSACNETPLYADLFGDGNRVLIMGWQPKGKDNEGQMAWFTPGSDSDAARGRCTPISEPEHPRQGRSPAPSSSRTASASAT